VKRLEQCARIHWQRALSTFFIEYPHCFAMHTRGGRCSSLWSQLRADPAFVRDRAFALSVLSAAPAPAPAAAASGRRKPTALVHRAALPTPLPDALTPGLVKVPFSALAPADGAGAIPFDPAAIFQVRPRGHFYLPFLAVSTRSWRLFEHQTIAFYMLVYIFFSLSEQISLTCTDASASPTAPFRVELHEVGAFTALPTAPTTAPATATAVATAASSPRNPLRRAASSVAPAVMLPPLVEDSALDFFAAAAAAATDDDDDDDDDKYGGSGVSLWGVARLALARFGAALERFASAEPSRRRSLAAAKCVAPRRPEPAAAATTARQRAPAGGCAAVEAAAAAEAGAGARRGLGLSRSGALALAFRWRYNAALLEHGLPAPLSHALPPPLPPLGSSLRAAGLAVAVAAEVAAEACGDALRTCAKGALRLGILASAAAKAKAGT